MSARVISEVSSRLRCCPTIGRRVLKITQALLVSLLALSITAGAQGLSADDAQSLVSEAQAAVTAQDYDRAIALYTKLLQNKEHQHHRHALEYLGVAREQIGQHAQAIAVYRQFLETYTEGDGVNRVRQRLAVLVTQGSDKPASRITSDNTKNNAARLWNTRTRISQFYRRNSNQFNDEDSVVSQSAIQSDLDVTAKRDGSRVDFSSRISAGYTLDQLPDDEGPGNLSRFSLLYAEWNDRVTRTQIRFGRQTRNRGGVAGRFDGAYLSKKFGEKLQLNLVAGFPVASSRDSIETDRQFQGLSLDVGKLADHWDLSLFGFAQQTGDHDTRTAVGGDLRYNDRQRNVDLTVDYDMGLGVVNRAILYGRLRLSPTFSVYTRANQVRSPYLTLENALRGQDADTLEELSETYTESELESLARDRSAIVRTLTLGASRKMTPRLSVAADVSAKTVGRKPESGGVSAVDATSTRTVNLSVTRRDLAREADALSVKFQLVNDDASDRRSVRFDYRFPLGEGFKLDSQLHVKSIDYDNSDTQDTFGIRLKLQKAWKRRMTLEAEVKAERSDRDLGVETEERNSLFVGLGYRYSF